MTQMSAVLTKTGEISMGDFIDSESLARAVAEFRGPIPLKWEDGSLAGSVTGMEFVGDAVVISGRVDGVDWGHHTTDEVDDIDGAPQAPEA